MARKRPTDSDDRAVLVCLQGGRPGNDVTLLTPAEARALRGSSLRTAQPLTTQLSAVPDSAQDEPLAPSLFTAEQFCERRDDPDTGNLRYRVSLSDEDRDGCVVVARGVHDASDPDRSRRLMAQALNHRAQLLGYRAVIEELTHELRLG